MFVSKLKLDKCVLKCWPKFLFPEKRKLFKKNMFRITVSHRRSESNFDTHIDPWAFIRVKNERTTLLASLNSILPVIHKGVIGYNECTDGSEEIIQDFCQKNPGFIPFHYPHHVVAACDKKYLEGLPYENTLAAYYNAVLDLIPKKEWLIKIDVDQIYFPEILRHSFSLPSNNREWVVYSRLDLYRLDGEIKVFDYKRPGDHWLIYNDGLYFTTEIGKRANGDFFAWEALSMEPRIKLRSPFLPECSSVHFPFEKKYRPLLSDGSKLIDFRDYVLTAPSNEISDEVLNYETIKSICAQFE